MTSSGTHCAFLGWKTLLDTQARHGRILLVEDDHEVRRSLAETLTQLGYEVTGSSSAEEADCWLSRDRFELMLLDLELPGMHGMEFLAWSLARDPELAVIVLSGADSRDLAVRCIEAGARTYLLKPTELEFLRLAVRDAIALRRVLVERNEACAEP